MIQLANISTSLEIANGNQIQFKTQKILSQSTVRHCYVQQFIVRDWVKERCSVIVQFGSLMCHLERGEDGLGPKAIVWLY